jgi:NAD(P)-dependent dehydrogenase (short-subunit alcohol dehydrogenase family)
MKNNKKVVIVTGGSGLLGKAMVNDIRRKGGMPINFDVNVEDDLDAGTLYCDITDHESGKAAVQKVAAHFGRIDGLVNNAYPRTQDFGTPFDQMSAESLSTNVAWQMNSYILLCQSVLEVMKPQKKGSIVNIASIYGVVGNDWTVYEGTDMVSAPAYSAIKGGIINFTRYLAALYGRDGLRINCVSPGGIFDHQPEPFVKAYEKKVPLRRMGTPEDIAPAVSFFLSEDAKYITGQNLVVDGGWTCI